MARDDWYRNTHWNETIEEAFFAKLRRARDKSQYLRIQACILAKSHPNMALSLLDQYFNLSDRSDDAQAHVDRASAFIAQGEISAAINSYKAALEAEKQRSSCLTLAYVSLPFLVASHGITAHFDECLTLLEQHKHRLTFPVDHFRWHSAYALILLDLGRGIAAQEHAQCALEYAARDNSGFRYHPNIGLVGKEYESICVRLLEAAA